jgi:hypothetical protein
MPAYLVRLIQNRDIVGFFAADDFDDLVVTVDECTEVSACEYVELPAGGIMWTSLAVPVPFDVRDREDEEAEIEELPWAKPCCPNYGGMWSMVTPMTSGLDLILTLRKIRPQSHPKSCEGPRG